MDTAPGISNAIERSRKARAAFRSRRHRTAILLVALAAGLAGGGTFAVDALTGGEIAHAAVNQAQSLADLLNGRSPGERTEAQLTKTKRAMRAKPKVRLAAKPAPALPPEEHALALAHLLQGPAVALEAPPLAGIPLGPPTIGELVIPPSGGGGGGGPGGGGGAGGGGGGGGGGGVIVPTPTPPTPPIVPPAPVPEPATWAMMLLGFGLIGWQVRRCAALNRSAPSKALASR